MNSTDCNTVFCLEEFKGHKHDFPEEKTTW